MRAVSASLVAAVVWAFVSAASAQSPTLDQVLARFSRVEGMQCRFGEELRSALFAMPVVSSGTIHYARPGRIARRFETPTPSVMLIENGSLRSRDRSGETRMDFASHPSVRGFVETFSLVMAGDRAALERVHTLSFTAERSTWTLTLVPRAAPLNEFVREIRFEGSGTSLRAMTITQAPRSPNESRGDVTTTTFTDVDTGRTYTADEAARVFSLDPR